MIGFCIFKQIIVVILKANMFVICMLEDASSSKQELKMGTVIDIFLQLFHLELLQIEASFILLTNSNRCTL